VEVRRVVPEFLGRRGAPVISTSAFQEFQASIDSQ
jgi:hypothetical protein